MSSPLAEVLDHHVEELRRAGVPSPEVDARLLAAHVLGDESGRSHAIVLAMRIPLQHLVGATWFRHVQLLCRPGVFIPRPETEVVAGIAIEVANRLDRPLVVEPCTGSGAIAASLVAEVPGLRLIATDRSATAVELARVNVGRVERGEGGVAARSPVSWEILLGDLFGPLDPASRGTVDVVVANPPYMPARDRATWEPEVALHDPEEATVGGDDGHEVVERLLSEARAWLRDGGTLVTEIDERRGAEAADHARALGYVDVRVERDLTRADRAVVGIWPGGALEPAAQENL